MVYKARNRPPNLPNLPNLKVHIHFHHPAAASTLGSYFSFELAYKQALFLKIVFNLPHRVLAAVEHAGA